MASITSLQDRITIDQLAQLEYTDAQIAAEAGWKIRTVLHVWRAGHPGWGPKTLRAELEADKRFAEQRLLGSSSP